MASRKRGYDVVCFLGNVGEVWVLGFAIEAASRYPVLRIGDVLCGKRIGMLLGRGP